MDPGQQGDPGGNDSPQDDTRLSTKGLSREEKNNVDWCLGDEMEIEQICRV